MLLLFWTDIIIAPGSRDREEGRAIYYELFGPFYYSFMVGNSYFIVLDDANMVRFGPPQMAWLKHQLMDAQSYAHTFVFLHVPLLAPEERLPRLLGTDPEHYFYHYVIVHVKGNQVTTAVVRFPSPPAELWDRLVHTAALYIHSYLVTNGLNLTFIALLLLLGYIAYRALRGRYERKRG